MSDQLILFFPPPQCRHWPSDFSAEHAEWQNSLTERTSYLWGARAHIGLNISIPSLWLFLSQHKLTSPRFFWIKVMSCASRPVKDLSVKLNCPTQTSKLERGIFDSERLLNIVPPASTSLSPSQTVFSWLLVVSSQAGKWAVKHYNWTFWVCLADEKPKIVERSQWTL